MDLVKTLKEILNESRFTPVEKEGRVELWEQQPDGKALPTGIFLDESAVFVEIVYDKRDVIITEDAFTDEDVENHMLRELEGLVKPLERLGFEKHSSRWLSASDQAASRDLLMFTFKRAYQIHEIRRIIDAIAKALEEMEIF